MLIRCPHKTCRQEYDVLPEFIGQKTKCKTCGRVFTAKPAAVLPDRPKPGKQVRVVCPNSICRNRYLVEDKIIGKKVRCPKCGRDFIASRWIDPPAAREKMITVKCPNPYCGQEYKIPEKSLGKKAVCPKCREQFVAGRITPPREKAAAPPEKEVPGDLRPGIETAAGEDNLHRPEPEPFSALYRLEREEPEPKEQPKGKSNLLPFLLLLFGLILLAGFLELQIMRLQEDLTGLRNDNSGVERILTKIQKDLAARLEAEKEGEQTGAKPKIKCHPGYDFRKTVWGMSTEVVKLSEGRKPDLNEGNTIGYKSEVGGRQFFVFYIFIKDQLVRSRYVLGERYKDKNQYLKDYQVLLDNLIKKYGPPREEKTDWLNDRYKKDEDKWGMAVSSGHLQYYSNWATCGTDIVLDLRGQNFDVDLVIEYASRKLSHLESNQSRENGDNAF